MVRLTLVIVATVAVIGIASGLSAQSATQTPRIVTMDGGAMRVVTAGFEHRKTGQPVVILEAGAGEGLDNWTPVFAQIAPIAPVLAYDRRGIGKSVSDGSTLTLRGVAETLHALFQEMKIPPPYVLVGHSWGGLLTRAYIDRYQTEVVGLVLLDAINPGLPREEKAKTVPPEKRAQVLAPPEFPAIPPDTPPGLRAEMELVKLEMGTDYPEGRSLRAPTGIPIVVITAMPPGRLKNFSEGFGIEPYDAAGLALRSPNGMFIVASHVGHMVHRSDPELVVQVIGHVLKHVPSK
jgi:pimeloyl-ACP methyl ester carboxylesterase